MKLLNHFHIICLLAAILAIAVTSVAQQPAFHHLTVENGLSQNAVIAIGQDSREFMWIGTSNGLNRYDGYRFQLYQSKANDSASLSSSSILSILSDSKKNLWIGTGNGLNKYLPLPDQFKRIQSREKNLINCQCLYEDSKGSIWVGTTGGLLIVKNDQLEPVALPKLNDSAAIRSIRTIFEDRSGNLWCLVQHPEKFLHGPDDWKNRWAIVLGRDGWDGVIPLPYPECHRLEFDAIGSRNEKGTSYGFAKAFRKSLDANGFPKVRLHGFDNWPDDSKFAFVPDLLKDAELQRMIERDVAMICADFEDDEKPF